MLHQDCERLDPRIRRTRQLLQDALKRLLEEKEFDKITIQNITEAATLNRATFYATTRTNSRFSKSSFASASCNSSIVEKSDLTALAPLPFTPSSSPSATI